MDCHNCTCSAPATARAKYIKQAKRLSQMTIGWNFFEGLAALLLGFHAGSVALIGFGLDSAIETASAIVIGLRFWGEENNEDKAEEFEHKAAKAVGSLLLCLAAYIIFDAVRKLIGLEPPAKESLIGIALAAAALVVMPVLAKAKYRAAESLGSGAMRAEAFQSLTCAWLAGATLSGLALNTLFHWNWADPAAALLFVPAIIKEGVEALRGKLCADCH